MILRQSELQQGKELDYGFLMRLYRCNVLWAGCWKGACIGNP